MTGDGRPAPAAETDAPGPAGTGGQRHRLVRWILVGVVVLVVLVVAAVVVFAPTAREVSTDEARERLGDATEGSVGEGLPAVGVYPNRGEGEESLSVPPLSQREGPSMPVTVTHTSPSCYRYRIDYSSNHWQDYRFCRTARGIEERGGRTWQRWRIGTTDITNLSVFRCDPGTMLLPAERTPGQAWQSRCTGTNEQVEGTAVSKGPYRYLGDEDLTIGGRKVRVAHFLRKRSMSGSQTGTEEADVWIDLATGLPVRNERHLRVDSDTPVGTSTYTEDGSYRMQRTTPAP